MPKISQKRYSQLQHILKNAREAQQFLLKDDTVLCTKSKFSNKNIFTNKAANDCLEPVNKLMGSKIALFHIAVFELEQFIGELKV